MALKAKAARGALWTLVEYGGGEGIAFLIFLVLARILAPSDFGLLGLALVFVSFVQVFLVQGFADAVIQRQDLSPDHCSTAFWTNVVIALVFWLLIVAGASSIATLFHEPHLAPVLRVLASLPIATALTSIHQALFKRQLDFANFAKRAVIGIGLGGIVGIALAVNGFGVWSLVFQQLTNAVASIVVLWRNSTWRPSLRFAPRCFWEMAEFSASVIGSNVVAFIGQRSDIWLVGYFFDADQLGYYYLVQRLLITIGLVTRSTVQAIVMPVLSRVQNESARFRNIFARTVEFVNAIWLPIAFGTGLVASLLLPVVFGTKWGPGAPLLEIMSLCGFTDALILYTAPTLAAAGRARPYLGLSVVELIITLASELVGAQFGVRGVAAALVLAAISIIPLNLFILRREVGIDVADLLKRCLPASAAGVVMAIAVLAAKSMLATALPQPAALVLLVTLGAFAYSATLALLAPSLVRQMIDLVAIALGRSAPTPNPAP